MLVLVRLEVDGLWRGRILVVDSPFIYRISEMRDDRNISAGCDEGDVIPVPAAAVPRLIGNIEHGFAAGVNVHIDGDGISASRFQAVDRRTVDAARVRRVPAPDLPTNVPIGVGGVSGHTGTCRSDAGDLGRQTGRLALCEGKSRARE